MTKKLKFLFLGLLLVVSFFALLNSRKDTPQPSKTEEVQIGSTLIIDYGDGKKETLLFTPQPGQTVFDALKTLAEGKSIAIETQKYDFGVFVKAIGAYPSSSDMAWIYFVNGTAGTIASDQQQIKSGDVIEWRYAKPEW